MKSLETIFDEAEVPSGFDEYLRCRGIKTVSLFARVAGSQEDLKRRVIVPFVNGFALALEASVVMAWGIARMEHEKHLRLAEKNLVSDCVATKPTSSALPSLVEEASETSGASTTSTRSSLKKEASDSSEVIGPFSVQTDPLKGTDVGMSNELKDFLGMTHEDFQSCSRWKSQCDAIPNVSPEWKTEESKVRAEADLDFLADLDCTLADLDSTPEIRSPPASDEPCNAENGSMQKEKLLLFGKLQQQLPTKPPSAKDLEISQLENDKSMLEVCVESSVSEIMSLENEIRQLRAKVKQLRAKLPCDSSCEQDVQNTPRMLFRPQYLNNLAKTRTPSSETTLQRSSAGSTSEGCTCDSDTDRWSQRSRDRSPSLADSYQSYLCQRMVESRTDSPSNSNRTGHVQNIDVSCVSVSTQTSLSEMGSQSFSTGSATAGGACDPDTDSPRPLDEQSIDMSSLVFSTQTDTTNWQQLYETAMIEKDRQSSGIGSTPEGVASHSGAAILGPLESMRARLAEMSLRARLRVTARRSASEIA